MGDAKLALNDIITYSKMVDLMVDLLSYRSCCSWGPSPNKFNNRWSSTSHVAED